MAGARGRRLVPDRFDGLFDRGAGNAEQAAERLVEFEDQEDRAGDRERAHQHRHHARGVETREYSESAEQQHRPGDDDIEQRDDISGIGEVAEGIAEMDEVRQPFLNFTVCVAGIGRPK